MNTVNAKTSQEQKQVIKTGFLVLLGTIAVVYHLWYTRTFGVERNQHLIVHLAIMMLGSGVVAYDPSGTTVKEKFTNFLVIFEGLLSVAAMAYIFLSYERIVYEQLGIYTDLDLYVGLLVIILLLDLIRHVYGVTLTAVGLLGIVYALFGPYFPGILQHGGIKPWRLVQGLTVEFAGGVFGTIVAISATYIVIFLILAGLLEAYGALEYFIQVGVILGRRIQTGLAQLTTVASMGMGSINGSAAANVATTGAFTIPLLKRHGLDKDTAASYEAVASSGGQIMPPIMGAAAFIMAQITATPYLDIIVIGFLPALLFYLSIAMGVHLTTLKEGMTVSVDQDEIQDIDFDQGDRNDALESIFGRSPSGVSIEEISVKNLILEGMGLWVPIVVLLYTLIVLLYDPLYAGFWAIVSALPAAFVQGVVLRDGYDTRDFVVDTFDGFGRGLENAAPIAVILGVMNIFVGVLNLTGFTQVFANSLIELSGGLVIALLFFAMIAALLFGLGMPTVAAYITAVLLIAPALNEMGIRLLTAHFFVFYFAILSAITPPVAVASLIAAEVAGGDFLRTSYKSLVLGTPLFVIPYVMVANESIMYWAFPETVTTFLLLVIAFAGFSATITNYLSGPLSIYLRAVLLPASIFVMFSPLLVDSLIPRAGAALLILAIFVQQSSISSFSSLRKMITSL